MGITEKDLRKIKNVLEKNKITTAGAIKYLGRKSSSKTVIFNGDDHVGSQYALSSPDPVRSDGLQVIPTRQMSSLYEIWETLPDKLTKKRANVWLVNGEPIDGVARRNTAVWTNSASDQIQDFIKCMKTFSYDHLLFTRGSPFHVDIDGTNFEEMTARAMNADAYKTYGGKGLTDYECNFEIFGKVINATHHVGFSGWQQYRPTSLARELVKMHFEHGKRRVHTDILARSHVHYYCQVKFTHAEAFSTPAWKLPDPHFYKGGLPQMPDIGVIEAVKEPNGDYEINPIIEDIDIEPMVRHF